MSFLRWDGGRFNWDWWPPVSAWAGALLVVVVASVMLRTKMPWAFLVITATPSLVLALGVTPPYSVFGLMLALMFAVYAVSSVSSLRVSIAAALIVGVPILAGVVAVLHVPIHAVFPVLLAAALGTSTAVGQVTSSRRRLIEATHRRALAAEEARESLVAMRVAEQRLATARDLHDAVGHQIAVINLQAGAARHAIPNRPEEALNSLMIIQQSAESVLAAIGDLLRDLRGEISPAPRRAQGLEALPELTRTLAAGGFSVKVHLDQPEPPLPREIDDALYKILTEALVNAYKHGSADAPADVHITQEGDAVVLNVSNPIDPSSSSLPSTGYGILGIQERARRLGGRAELSQTDDSFELTVSLPLRTR